MAVFTVAFAYSAPETALAALRPARHEYFADLEQRGALLASGQLASGELGDGMLVLRAADEAQARAILAEDPFAVHGCVGRADIAAWNPTIGTWLSGDRERG